MFHAYEFSSQVSEQGQVTVPAQIAAQLPTGEPVRILILVDENATAANGHGKRTEVVDSALEELIAEIKRTPSKPENIIPGSGLLAEHLANPVSTPDPDFDERAWNQEWDRIEAEMNAESLAHEEEELKDLFP